MSEIFNILGISDRVKYEGKRITKIGRGEKN